MNSLALRTVILWTHALGGVAWAGSSACFVIAGWAAGTRELERRAFVQRVAPAINRVAMFAMLFVLASGIVNLFIAGSTRQFHFSDAFLTVLGMKIAIFIAMFALLGASFRAAARLSATGQSPPAPAARLLVLNGAIAALGGIALMLGLWLLGA